MGSRLRENPDRTFYWFFQASCPIARDKDPGVLFHYPDDFSDEECLQALPRFCFPYDIERVRDGAAVQHFTFALTDLEGRQRFGFCRLTSSSQTCLCILSYLPWFEVFYKLLNNLADCITKGQTNEMLELLTTLYGHPVPSDSGSPVLPLIPYFIAPDPKVLPTIPESRNLTELVLAVDVGNLLQLYASMLFERRILICCNKLSTLTACIHACGGVLYPMYWQHIFIPVLPPHLLDYCCAPMPYLIGVHSSLIERVKSPALEDVVILNVDTNTMESPHDDLKRLPSDVVTALKMRLKRQASSPGSGVARAFLRAQALLFGAYREALQCPPGGPVLFNEEMFLTHKSASMRQFLQTAVHLQLFKQFIDGRLEMLNQNREPDDLFEEEILHCGASSGGSKSYQQWVSNLKKGGGSLILTVKSKAQMYKNAKYPSKFGIKNLIPSKEHKERPVLQRGGSVCGTHSYRFNKSDCLQSRLPITQHFGKSRPKRPTRNPAVQQGEEAPQEDCSSWAEESRVELPYDDLTEEEEALSMMPDLEEMDLLGEIFDTLSCQTASEPGLLYSTRSLDLFSSDCTDFISRTSLITPSQESLSPSFGNNGSLRSWEEGLEEGPEPGLELKEFEASVDESERKEEEGATTVHIKPNVDLGRLVDDFVDLGVKLEEELSADREGTSGSLVEHQAGRSTEGSREKTSRSLEESHEETGSGEEFNEENQETRRSEGNQEDASASSAEHPEELDDLTDSEKQCGPEEDSKASQEHQDQVDPAREPPAEKEDKKDRKTRQEDVPKVLSKVALFQLKTYHTKGPSDPGKPGSIPKSLDPGALMSNPATEDEDPPLPKVSELKKRFEH
ncbi:DENN domain-containing protein 1B isoform X2 [Trichomycterus rosablanca]|uniref:DENN domain-containing protein 1B isoform X2 n=1 Tax=Trichomycterus rosablanca TaxID=2290929 RepID=UPI002F35BF99